VSERIFATARLGYRATFFFITPQTHSQVSRVYGDLAVFCAVVDGDKIMHSLDAGIKKTVSKK
jgi:hypothetical protein